MIMWQYSRTRGVYEYVFEKKPLRIKKLNCLAGKLKHKKYVLLFDRFRTGCNVHKEPKGTRVSRRPNPAYKIRVSGGKGYLYII